MTTITHAPFGTCGQGAASLYTLKNERGMTVSVLDYGAAIVSIRVPDKNGSFDDVVLGYDELDGYRSKKYYLGATIGRFCNRIARGRFSLGDKEYQLACNDNGVNHLHGGEVGFDQRLWEAEIVHNDEVGQMLVLRLESLDGEDGYPGTLSVALCISLDEENALALHYRSQSDADTLCSLTNHSYFNLSGHDSGDVLEHQLRVCASHFLEADAQSIPTGRVLPVADTPMDFRVFHTVGARIDEDNEQLRNGNGYDHCWVLDKKGDGIQLAAQLYDPKSGRLLSCYTDSPCIQVYSGNFIDGSQPGKGGHYYTRRSGICLETQFAPDSPNHPEWESPVLRAGEFYDNTTIYQFGIK